MSANESANNESPEVAHHSDKPSSSEKAEQSYHPTSATPQSSDPTEAPHKPSNNTTSEATSPNQEIYDLSEKAFTAVADYVRGDLAMTIEDYSVLCEMNRVATKKYADMRQVANEVGKSLGDLNDKYRALQPYLDQIDQLESSVAQLEQAAYRLDNYAKRLENRFKQLEKR